MVGTRLSTCLRAPRLMARAPVGRRVQCRYAFMEPANITEVRELLSKRGWHRAWIDGVTERVVKEQMTQNVEEMTNVLDAMDAIGLKGAQVEHTFVLAPDVWARTPEQITAVADYIRAQGVQDVAKVIFQNPKLLEFDVAGDELASGRRARAKVSVTKDDDGEEKILVSYYAANASFQVAPLSPFSP